MAPRIIGKGTGSARTGGSTILSDSSGQPTGIPVPFCKEWHKNPETGVDAVQWIHGKRGVPTVKQALDLIAKHGFARHIAMEKPLPVHLEPFASSFQLDVISRCS